MGEWGIVNADIIEKVPGTGLVWEVMIQKWILHAEFPGTCMASGEC